MSDTHAHNPRPRRVIGAIAVVGLLVAALATYLATPGSGQTVGGPPSAASPGTVASSADPSATPPVASASPSATAPTGPPGPGVTEPGVLVTATLVGSDALTVQELVRVADPITTVTLRPIDLTRLSSDFDGQTASADDVELTAGGTPLVVPDGEVSEEVELTLPQPVTSYTLTYRLQGTVVRTLPSAAGRGLGAVGPLSMVDDLPLVVYATGRSVLNLYCPTRADIAQQACASGDLPRLHTNGTLPSRDGLVVIQLNLSGSR